MGSRRALGSRYELQERLGSGAMGEVWLTLDRTSGDHVAAKLLRRELTEDPEIVGRFIQERSILLGLRHDNVVRVRDLVVEGDDLAIVMDLVTGSDVRTLLDRSGTCTPREAVEVVAAVLDALAAAHAAGCLHRDVKPDNVLLAEGPAPIGTRVRLSDFGIARLAQDSTVQATGLLGTPGYMPPELFSEGRFSGASDVYAAGVMLYELVAGRTPFAGAGTAHTVGFRHVTAAPPVLPVAPELWHVLDALLAKDPTVRPTPATAARMLRGLPDAVLDASPLSPQPEPTEWVSVAAAAPASVIQPRADDSIDVGATHLKGLAPVAAPVAAQGEVKALAGGADAALVDGETNLARRDRAFEAPVLAPGAPTVEVERRRRMWVWVAVAAAVVVLAGGGYLVVTSLTGGNGGGSGAPVTFQADPVSYPSGLEVAREATFDPETGSIDLVMTFDSTGGPLRGDVLQVMPEVEGQGCPEVTWDVETTLNVTRATGIRSTCPGQVVPVAVESGGSQRVEATVGADLGSDPEQALETWLGSQADATAAAVDDPDVVKSTAYVLQRLAGIEVVVPSTLTFADKVVPVKLFPRWSNGEPDDQNVLYDSDNPGPRTQMLAAVAGDEELRFNPGPSCDGAVYAGPGGAMVLEGRAVDGCTLTTSIGRFTDLESNALTVVGPRS